MDPGWSTLMPAALVMQRMLDHASAAMTLIVYSGLFDMASLLSEQH
jgi:hypothetical protein